MMRPNIVLLISMLAQPVFAGLISTPACTHNNFLILEAVLPTMLERSLVETHCPEAQTAAAFLSSHRNIRIRIGVLEDSRMEFAGQPVMPANVEASFSPHMNEIYINHELMHIDASDEGTLLSNQPLLRGRVRDLLPTWIHEISHARSAHGPLGLLEGAMEEEYLAFYREMVFILEQLARDPGYRGIAELAPCARAAHANWIESDAHRTKLEELKRRPRSSAFSREAQALLAKMDRSIANRKELARRCPKLGPFNNTEPLLLAAYAVSSRNFERYVQFLYADRTDLSSIEDPDFIAHFRSASERKRDAFQSSFSTELAKTTPSDPAYKVYEEMERQVGAAREHAKRVLEFLDDTQRVKSAITAKKAELALIREQAGALRIKNSGILKPFGQ